MITNEQESKGGAHLPKIAEGGAGCTRSEVVLTTVRLHAEDFAEGDAATRQELLSGGSTLEFSFVLRGLVFRSFEMFRRPRRKHRFGMQRLKAFS